MDHRFGRSSRFLALPALLLASGLACGEDAVENNGPGVGPTGSLKIQWDFVDENGDPVSCQLINILEVQVAIGGEPRVVGCGESDQTTFTGLLPGRFPVVIQLLGLGGTSLDSHQDNAWIEADQETVYQHSFVYTPEDLGLGRLKLPWRIDGIAASERCATVGAETLHIKSEPESIEDIETTAPCTNGEITLENLKSGTHTLLLTLKDAQNQTVLTPKLRAATVVRGELSEADIANYESVGFDYANVFAEWSVDGGDPNTTCGPAGGFDVEITVVRQAQGGFPSTTIQTATAACTDGQMLVDEIVAGRTPVNVAVTLFNSIQATITSSVVTGLSLVDGETTTVAVDLQTM